MEITIKNGRRLKNIDHFIPLSHMVWICEGFLQVAIVTFDVSVGRHAVTEQLHVRLRWLHPDSRSCHNKSIKFQPDEARTIPTHLSWKPDWGQRSADQDILFRDRDVYMCDISGGGGGSISGCRKSLFSFVFPADKQQDTSVFTCWSSGRRRG